MKCADRLAELKRSLVGRFMGVWNIEAWGGGGEPYIAVEFVDIFDVGEAAAVSQTGSGITWCGGRRDGFGWGDI